MAYVFTCQTMDQFPNLYTHYANTRTRCNHIRQLVLTPTYNLTRCVIPIIVM